MKRLFLLIFVCITIYLPLNAQDNPFTIHISDGEEYKGIKDEDTQTILVMVDGKLLESGHVAFKLYKDSTVFDDFEVKYNVRKSSAMVKAQELRKIEMADSLRISIVAYSNERKTEDEVYYISFPSKPERIDHIVINILHKNKKWRKKHKYSYITMAYYRNDIMLGSTGGGTSGKWFTRRHTFYTVE